MYNVLKYALICVGVVILEWIFLAMSVTAFGNSLDGAIVGAAFFLAVEIIICTGVILSKIDKNK